MSRRSVQNLIADVQKRVGGKVAVGKIFTALCDANKRANRLERWPWLMAESNIGVNGTYTTGTVSITDGTTTLTGAGTTWDNVNWRYKRLYVGSNTDYEIASFGGVGSATLAQAISAGQDYTAVSYTIFQNVYALPSDYEPGTELLIVNPRIRYRLLKLPRETMEARNVSLGVYFQTYQDSFADAGYDATNKVYLIKFAPNPGSATEYKLIYRKRPPDLATITDTTFIPESFDEALVFIAEYLVKRTEGIPGWAEAKEEGYQILQNLRRQVMRSNEDIFALYSNWSAQAPSMFASGVIINPPTSGS